MNAPLNREDASFRRYEKPLHQRDESSLTAFEKNWREKTGKPISKIKAFFGRGGETHRSLHLSSGGKWAISMSSKDRVRIYDAESGRLQTTIERDIFSTERLGDRFEVITIGTRSFVIGVESMHHQKKYSSAGLLGFFPDRLVLLDFQGRRIDNYTTDVRVKSSQISDSRDLWISADQNQLYIFDTTTGKQVDTNAYTSALFHRPDISRDDYINAIGLSADGRRLHVALHALRSTEATILTFDITNITQPRLIESQKLPVTIVYALREDGRGHLVIEAENAGSNGAVKQFVISPAISPNAN